MEDIYFDSEDKKSEVHATVWRPEGKPKGIIQIIHGMAEYGGRYAPTAEFFVENGYLVGADDHLGHGETAKAPELLGYFCDDDPVGTVMKDLRKFTFKLREIEPDAPLFILGHSMGSFFARLYAASFGVDLAGAVIMGTGYQSSFMTGAGLCLASLTGAFRGKMYRSKFLDSVAFGSYNKKLRPERTPFDWLSVMSEIVDRYIEDPFCGFTFTVNGFKTLFSVVRLACKKETFLLTPKSLPLYIVSGSDDPVGGYGKGVEKVYDMYADAGMEDLSMMIYRDTRHEILNDVSAMQVRDDLLEFFSSHGEMKAKDRS
ncbi:MAG: alpha/beta hydrolase [Clostridia bacterium]|nr:alpha/beta hydrolase [Clostridia bacterium]